MTKYLARVTRVLHPGIHKIGTVQDGEVRPIASLPPPDRIEIEMDGGRHDPCMIFRYPETGEVCGDTWHKNLAAAFAQANFEYGLTEQDFALVNA
jgi:hypothetical protein